MSDRVDSGRRDRPTIDGRLADLDAAAGRLQRLAAAMALLADLPGLRHAVLAGDADTAAAGLEALSAAAVRVSEAARWVACVTRLVEAEAMSPYEQCVREGVTFEGHDPSPLA